MIPEAHLEQAEAGLVPRSDGWFVLNARDAPWRHQEGRGERVRFEGDSPFSQVGVGLYVLQPGEPTGMYHWEADQEDFLVVSGEPLLLIEGQERALRQWDFVHCPPRAAHVIVGAGDGPAVVLAVGAREHQDSPGWGGYPVEALARHHGVGVEHETSDAVEAYARFPAQESSRYRRGWLPGDTPRD
jgi:uncharacterized cupin superfamily protein